MVLALIPRLSPQRFDAIDRIDSDNEDVTFKNWRKQTSSPPMRILQQRRSRRPKLMTNNCSMALVATASCALASLVAIYFFSVSRLASQSRDWAWPFRSVSILPLIESPLILPLYLAVNL